MTGGVVLATLLLNATTITRWCDGWVSRRHAGQSGSSPRASAPAAAAGTPASVLEELRT
jgi:hypothetical protein